MVQEDGVAELKAVLAKDFERLDGMLPHRKLGERAVRFVADGTDDSCLLEIKGMQNNEMVHFVTGQMVARWDSLDALSDAPVAILHRFATLMLVSAQSCGALGGWYGNQIAGPDWLRAYLLTSHCRPYQSLDRPKNRRLYSIGTLRRLNEHAKEPLDGLIESVYASDGYAWRRVWDEMEGRDGLLREEPGRVAAVAARLDADARSRLLADIAKFKLGTLYADLVFAWAVDSAKRLRVAAQAALADMTVEDLLARAARVLESGAATERYEIVLFLKKAAGSLAAPLLEGHLDKESTKRVKDAIAETLGAIQAAPAPTLPEGAFRSIDGTIFQIPPMPDLPPDTPLPAAAMEPLRHAVLAHNAWAEEDNERRKGEKYFHPTRLLDPREIDLFLDVANRTKSIDWVYGDPLGQLLERRAGHRPAYDSTGVDQFFAQPGLTLWHCIRGTVSKYKDRLVFHSHLDASHWVDALLFAPVRRALQGGLDF